MFTRLNWAVFARLTKELSKYCTKTYISFFYWLSNSSVSHKRISEKMNARNAGGVYYAIDTDEMFEVSYFFVRFFFPNKS